MNVSRTSKSSWRSRDRSRTPQPREVKISLAEVLEDALRPTHSAIRACSISLGDEAFEELREAARCPGYGVIHGRLGLLFDLVDKGRVALREHALEAGRRGRERGK